MADFFAVGFYRDGRVLPGYLKDGGFQPTGKGESEAFALLSVASDPSNFRPAVDKYLTRLQKWLEKTEALLLDGKSTRIRKPFKLGEPAPVSVCVSLSFAEAPGLVEHYAFFGLLSDVALEEGAYCLHPVGTGYSLCLPNKEGEAFFGAITLASILQEVALEAGLPDLRFGIAISDTFKLRPGLFVSPAQDLALLLAVSCKGDLVGLASSELLEFLAKA